MSFIILWGSGIVLTYAIYGFIWWYETRLVLSGRRAIFLRFLYKIDDKTVGCSSAGQALLMYLIAILAPMVWPLLLFLIASEYYEYYH